MRDETTATTATNAETGHNAPAGAEPLTYRPIAAPVEAVVLFEDRAEVRRATRYRAGEGGGVSSAAGAGLRVIGLEIGGITAGVDDGSLLISAVASAGEARVLSAQIRRRVEVEGEAAEAREAARRAVEAAKEALQAIQARRRAAAESLQRQEDLCAAWLSGISTAPPADALPSWEAGWIALQAPLPALFEEIRAIDLASKEAERALKLAQARHAAAQRTRQRVVASALLQLQLDPAAAAADIEIGLRYLAPCALWRPAHEARLPSPPPAAVPALGAGSGVGSGAGSGAPPPSVIEWRTMAVAWNATGEDWRGVRLSFSTARPGRAADPPLLTEDLLSLRAKTEEERRTIRVEAREVEIQRAGEDGGRRLDDLPGVEDGGEPLTFAAPDRGDLPSTGEPVWFPLDRRELAATVERVCWPERGEAVHLRARATNTLPAANHALHHAPNHAPPPLLAGPIRLSRGASWIGVGRLEFVPAGEPFSVGFGVDDALTVRRRTEDKRETAAIVGTQKLQRTVRLYVGNHSGERRALRIIERVPGSEIAEVTVALTEDGGGSLDKDGLLTIPLSLEPNERRTVQYTWKLEASSKVVLPAL